MSIIGVSFFLRTPIFCVINIYVAKMVDRKKTDTKDNKHAKDTKGNR